MQILITVVLHSSRYLLNLQTKHVIFHYEPGINEGHMYFYKILYVRWVPILQHNLSIMILTSNIDSEDST